MPVTTWAVLPFLMSSPALQTTGFGPRLGITASIRFRLRISRLKDGIGARHDQFRGSIGDLRLGAVQIGTERLGLGFAHDVNGEYETVLGISS